MYGLPPSVKIEDIFKFMRDNGFTELEKVFRQRLYDKVGKTGQNFSGGMRNLIWLLRAIMKPCSMIIGDEITQSLDPESTKHVTKMIDILSRDKTILIITHNLDTINNFDRIITMEKGKIISDLTKNKKNN